ncbi:DUF5329 family protein [Microbulbifer sp. VTAC004]
MFTASRKKYNYFSRKIDDAKNFIELNAGKNTFSCKPYRIQYENQPK